MGERQSPGVRVTWRVDMVWQVHLVDIPLACRDTLAGEENVPAIHRNVRIAGVKEL